MNQNDPNYALTKLHFNVRHKTKVYKCFLQNGEVWCIKTKGRPEKVNHGRRITTMNDAEEAVLFMLENQKK